MYTAYAASKFAVGDISEALAREVEVFSIGVLVVEPGGFKTNLISNLKTPTSKIGDCDGTPADKLVNLQHIMNGKQPGDPVKGAKRIVEAATDKSGDVLARRGGGEVLQVFFRSSLERIVSTFDEILSLLGEMAKRTDFI